MYTFLTKTFFSYMVIYDLVFNTESFFKKLYLSWFFKFTRLLYIALLLGLLFIDTDLFDKNYF